MGLTKAQRAERERKAMHDLRLARVRGGRYSVATQDGRKRPVYVGRVVAVSMSDSFAMLDTGDGEPLHIPAGIIRKVERA